jgi:hypothetical protein
MLWSYTSEHLSCKDFHKKEGLASLGVWLAVDGGEGGQTGPSRTKTYPALRVPRPARTGPDRTCLRRTNLPKNVKA